MSAICAIENRTAVGALELRSKILKRAKWLRFKRALFTVRKLAPGSGCHVGVIIPSGSTERIYCFETVTKASEWIESQFQEWLAKHWKAL
jgi:hypothetical protein